MAIPVIMPRQGQSVESCVITAWRAHVGDAVKAGDVLFAYETDKAAFEENAPGDGTLLAVFFEEGDDVPVLTNVCALGSPGESFAEYAPQGDAPAAIAAEAASAPVPTATAPAVAAVAATEPVPVADVKLSPRARALADRSGADLSMIVPSGPDGRAIERDVQALLDRGAMATYAARAGYMGGVEGTGIGGRVTLADVQAATALASASIPAPVSTLAPTPAAAKAEQPSAPAVDTDEYREEPLSNMRKVIAKAMTASLFTMAQLTHHLSFDCTEILALRKHYKEKGERAGMDRVTLNDILLYAVARTLKNPAHAALNAHLVDDKLRYFHAVNLGMAVDTERGLMVPTIFGADKLSLKQISDEAKRLAAECQGGSISPDFLRGASFTVSNLGALGIELFTPVINPPQTGILGVNAITTGVRDENGQVAPYPKMGLSLTYDHRALDGSPASRFLKDLKENLENFTVLLARG